MRLPAPRGGGPRSPSRTGRSRRRPASVWAPPSPRLTLSAEDVEDVDGLVGRRQMDVHCGAEVVDLQGRRQATAERGGGSRPGRLQRRGSDDLWETEQLAIS